MTIGVVVAAYEWPEALHAVLLGLADQSDDDFEVVVANGGRARETAAVVEFWSRRPPLRHVGQEDNGSRLARVRNLGAGATTADSPAFIDGAVVPRRHFIRALR